LSPRCAPPIPADIDVTIDEIAKNFVSGFTLDATANGERSHASAGLGYRRRHDVTEPDNFQLKF
jgi:hypothetical protein